MTFEEFWPYYLREHSDPRTRAIHVGGTVAALVCLGAFALTRNAWWLPAALVSGYAPAWTAHALIEKNKPATFKYPIMSLRADFTMLAHALRGTLNQEVEKQSRGGA